MSHPLAYFSVLQLSERNNLNIEHSQAQSYVYHFNGIESDPRARQIQNKTKHKTWKRKRKSVKPDKYT